MARLVVADGSTYELAGGEMLVGRGERELDDPPKINVGPLRGSLTVSRRHARLREHVGRWYLQVDGHSTNPTLVDGYVVPKGTEVPLNDGSRIQLGEVALTFRGSSAGSAGAELTITPEDAPHPTGSPSRSSRPPRRSRPRPARPAPHSWAARLPASSAGGRRARPARPAAGQSLPRPDGRRGDLGRRPRLPPQRPAAPPAQRPRLGRRRGARGAGRPAVARQPGRPPGRRSTRAASCCC